MPLPSKRPVKPRADVADDENDFEEFSGDDSSPSILETGDAEDADIMSSSGGEEEAEEENAKNRLSNISFGTLSKAHESLSLKRKRETDDAPAQQEKLDALRARLRELREAKAGDDKPSKKKSKKSEESEDKTTGKKSRKSKKDDSDSENDSDSDESDDDGAPKSRSSKHAPASQSSKRAVTRKRTAIEVPKKHIRDPRFGPLGGPPADDLKLAKAYSFLNEYQESEMNELRTAIKKSKDEDEKETLKRELLSMQSKRKARENKEREQEVLREHRKKEKEAIKEGKNPFFLKRADQKQLAMVEKFNSMKSKDREKLMERRRKKVAGKEKKNMPAPRRM